MVKWKYPQTGLTKNMAPGHCNSCTCTAESIMRMLIWKNWLRHQSLRFASIPQYRKNKRKWQQQNYKRIQLYKVSHHLYMWGWLVQSGGVITSCFQFLNCPKYGSETRSSTGPVQNGPLSRSGAKRLTSPDMHLNVSDKLVHKFTNTNSYKSI